MDLVGDMLHATLHGAHRNDVVATQIRPTLPFAADGSPDKLSRLFGRFVHYPRELRRVRRQFDLFHIVDHSYAHLVHALPAERTIVTCHDLDTFRSVLTPELERRSFAFRAMTRRILSGFQHAAHITCDTAATRDAILVQNLVPADRLTVVHNGVHPGLSPDPDPTADDELSYLLHREPRESVELLHVGSTITRKRLDVLLRVFAEARRHRPDLRLLRVGGEFTAEQEVLANSLGIRAYIEVLPRLSPELLAAAYRRVAVLLQPSESEGFGLPIIEAMACGTPVIASDIPALREIGGTAVRFCPVADIPAWTAAALAELTAIPHRAALVKQAGNFTWPGYTARMVEIYQKVIAQ